MAVTYQDVVEAHERIRPFIHRTPVITSQTFNEKFGCQAYFKAECFQKSGSFKIRGATNAILQVSEEDRKRGLLTFSSGNHAQALALAGRTHGAPITVVMPHDAPKIKKEATLGYGAEVILYDRNEETREALAAKLSEERGLTVIPPYDHPWIIAGAGTAIKELLEEVPDLDEVIICCGGGGLLAGSALSAKGIKPEIIVRGVEPDAGDDVCRSFASGKIETVANPLTLADGARTPSTGKNNFEIIRTHVDAMHSVSDKALWRAMYFLWMRAKVMAEPTGALAMASIWEGKVDASGKKVGILISGGNCDPEEVLAWGRSQGLLG